MDNCVVCMCVSVKSDQFKYESGVNFLGHFCNCRRAKTTIIILLTTVVLS